MSFKIKTIILFLAVSVIPFTITMLFFGSSLRSEQSRSVIQELNTQLNITIERIEQNLQSIEKDMAFMSRSEVMTDIFTDDLDKRISRMLLNKKEDLELIGDFYVVNMDNTVVASSNFAEITKKFGKKPFFFSEIISPYDHKKIATLYLDYSLKNLQRYFTNTSYRHYYLSQGGDVKLLQPKQFNASLSVQAPLKTLKNISIVLEEEKKHAYQLLEKYEKWFVVILLIGTLMIVVIALFVAMKLIHPLINLSNTAKNITMTQDYTQRVDVDRKDEIGKLANAFNEMTEGMGSALTKITALNTEIEDTQREVVFTMGAIGESRSKETGNHVKRVAEYSRLLAVHYGLDQEEAELLKQASPMHDIGKVAIADAILNKPGKLTEEEFERMKEHARLGYEMLKSSNRPLLKAAAIVAHEHHEKYNGKGYPNGLRGEDIHIYGRITAIADVFDALGSDRAYKRAWEDDRIFAFFKEERGEHFDPKLIDIFFIHLDEFLEIRTRLRDTFE